MRQLPLPVGLRDDNSFDSFLPAVNGEALFAVRGLASGRESFVYLHGEQGSGRTHLIEAVVEARSQMGEAVVYVALAGASRPAPEILEGVGSSAALVCLDDVDMIAGDRRWEEALFHLFNEIRARGACLLVTARAAPAAVGWHLADLGSRMSSGLIVRMAALDDDDRLAVLTFRASRRGLDLPPETGRYLLTRASRRLDDLVALLGRLDQAALVAHQRRLTVPFVRQLLHSGG